MTKDFFRILTIIFAILMVFFIVLSIHATFKMAKKERLQSYTFSKQMSDLPNISSIDYD